MSRPAENRASVLLIDKNSEQRRQLRSILSDLEVVDAADEQTAVGLLRQHEPAVALLELDPSPDGTDAKLAWRLLETVLEAAQFARVVVTTGPQGARLGPRAIGRGAWDFHVRPFDAPVLRGMVGRALHLAGLEREHQARQEDGGLPVAFPGLIGESAVMLAVRRQLERVGPTDLSVIVTGESGTGKEVVARALHASSARHRHRFVPINCAAIPETLLESELFGYERGAFTGAVRQTPGRIEHADRGTLFLDEIGDLPLGLQAKLLRFLQERTIERVGGRKEIAVDVRVVCATHRDLAELMRDGRFREDLYYRLAEIAVHLPPVRERNGDAVLMARHFLGQYAGPRRRQVARYSPEALHALDDYPWPGNVRELQNWVKRAVIMSAGPRITPQDLDLPGTDAPADLNLHRRRSEIELSVLRRALARCDGNLTTAARLIGVSRPTIYDLLRHHGLRS